MSDSGAEHVLQDFHERLAEWQSFVAAEFVVRSAYCITSFSSVVLPECT